MQPVPGYAVTTPYGKRGPYWSCEADANGNGIHTGADIAAPVGAKVVAARPGRVVHSNHGAAFGNHQVDLIVGDGTRDFYAHMRSRVPHGTQLEAGAKVGEVGIEGNVSGAHLHFERHATETGGWSCAVVRDPAPSLNYQPSGGSGGGTGGSDDMPEYCSARISKAVKLKAGAWYAIAWDVISSGDVIAPGGVGIDIPGRRYSLALQCKVTDREGAVVRTSFVERQDGQTVEENPDVSHDRDYLGDSRVGAVGKGRVLRCRVKCDHDATLARANLALVFW